MRQDERFNFKLKAGDELIQCTKGFTFNRSISNISPHTPDKVIVLKEYDRFILVEAHFEKNGGKSYRECINKAAYFSGDEWFKKLTEGC